MRQELARVVQGYRQKGDYEHAQVLETLIRARHWFAVWRVAKCLSLLVALAIAALSSLELTGVAPPSVLYDVVVWIPTPLAVSVHILAWRHSRRALATLTRCQILDGEIPADQGLEANGAGAWLVAVLAHCLPSVARPRFVAEERGNLGDCEHWWQRADQLAGLLIGTPRLAWMMWRDNSRGRA